MYTNKASSGQQRARRRSIVTPGSDTDKERLPSFVLGQSKLGYAVLGETGSGNLKLYYITSNVHIMVIQIDWLLR